MENHLVGDNHWTRRHNQAPITCARCGMDCPPGTATKQPPARGRGPWAWACAARVPCVARYKAAGVGTTLPEVQQVSAPDVALSSDTLRRSMEAAELYLRKQKTRTEPRGRAGVARAATAASAQAPDLLSVAFELGRVAGRKEAPPPVVQHVRRWSDRTLRRKIARLSEAVGDLVTQVSLRFADTGELSAHTRNFVALLEPLYAGYLSNKPDPSHSNIGLYFHALKRERGEASE